MPAAANRAGERSLLEYLVLPRPGDLSKAIVIPLGFLLAVVATGLPDAHAVVRAVVVWIAVEYLAYQARYQWNDLRGFWSDQRHPDHVRRGRLPGPVDRAGVHMRASAAVLAARLVIAALLIVVLPQLELESVLLPAIAGIFAAALCYESIRARAARRPRIDRPSVSVVGTWVVSGAGYCVRGLTGVALGAEGGLSPLAAVVAGGACWMCGIMFVTSRWAVESLPFARVVDGRLVWRADPEQGRGHLLPLSRWIPQEDLPRTPLDFWRPLWGGSPADAPWNLSLALAVPLACLSGWVLTDDGAPPAQVLLAVALPAVAVLGLYLMCIHQRGDDMGRGWERLRAAVAPRRRIPEPSR